MDYTRFKAATSFNAVRLQPESRSLSSALFWHTSDLQTGHFFSFYFGLMQKGSPFQTSSNKRSIWERGNRQKKKDAEEEEEETRLWNEVNISLERRWLFSPGLFARVRSGLDCLDCFFVCLLACCFCCCCCWWCFTFFFAFVENDFTHPPVQKTNKNEQRGNSNLKFLKTQSAPLSWMQIWSNMGERKKKRKRIEK